MILDLHQLAALPAFGSAADAIRRSIDPLWGRFYPDDPADGPQTWSVRVKFVERIEGGNTLICEADSEGEAEAIAREWASNHGSESGGEVDDIWTCASAIDPETVDHWATRVDRLGDPPSSRKAAAAPLFEGGRA